MPVQVVDDSDDLHRSQASPQEVSAFDLIGLRMAHTALQEDYAQMRSDLRRVLLLSARALKPHCAKGPQWLGPNPEMQAFQSILEVLEMDPSHPALVG
ncbi:MAG: hypothetical protein A2579_12340 [Lysobacterales bacterium RIFOXYD1_FULL_69_11]|nr:MAG: hypothetical protein A2579_12340 [Xanthomonadales bacterium RIFOXYD1_FULL_69_11]